MVDFPTETGIRLTSDIVPIFLCEEREGLPPITLEQTGTAFRLTDDLIVTCWHCVPDDDRPYAVAFETGDKQYRMHPLLDVSRDFGGADLATARLHDPEQAPPCVGLQLATVALANGADVSTWGYPLTSKDPQQGGPRFTLNARYLEGYVTRSFWYAHPVDGHIATYEVDMPAPAGLSGAPLLRRGSKEVVGSSTGGQSPLR